MSNPTINAAQSSHLGRIGRESPPVPFTTLGSKVWAHETAFPKECTFLAHAAGYESANTRFAVLNLQ